MRLIAIGGSDAGIAAGLRARELDPDGQFTVVVADAFPNYSICGIPYYVSGEVGDWHNLAHRTHADLTATGMELHLGTTADRIDPDQATVTITDADGRAQTLEYDALIVGTGATPVRPPIDGLDTLGSADGVHLLHSMDDTFALMRSLDGDQVRRAVIVGAGYIGLEMAEGLTTRGLEVTQIEQLPQVLSTVDADLGRLVHDELSRRGVRVVLNSRVQQIRTAADPNLSRLEVVAGTAGSEQVIQPADVVLVVVGVRPNTSLAASAGVELGAAGAIAVDRTMRTSLPRIYAAGDCAITHHRLLGESYLPLGTTAHKQGRVAAENALGYERQFAGSLGTQVVKVFDLVAARTGLRAHEARSAGFDPVTVAARADDHKAYYPGAHPIEMRYTADRQTRRLLGLQLIGGLRSEIAKRVDIAATAIFTEMTINQISDLDLSYTPPLGSPWDAIQAGAQAWERSAFPGRGVGPLTPISESARSNAL